MSHPIRYFKKSFKKTLQFSYGLISGIMIIPTVYAIVVSNIHTRQYDDIITNVSKANQINQIVKEELPNELWEIVCGKKDFYTSTPYMKLRVVNQGILDMENNTQSLENRQKLEVANRAYITLKHNIEMLESRMRSKSTVAQNEASLDEIRTITALFSEIIQDYILSEIESAERTNSAIKQSSLTLTILQMIIIILSFFVSLTAYISVSQGIRRPICDMQILSSQISQGNLAARTQTPDVEELIPLASNLNLMAEQIDLLIKKNIEEQKSLQKSEMKALQAQITPHFLYNTFDTIIWLAEQEQIEEVVKITKAFSQFLRISLSRGHEWITVEHELEHISTYLTIQKIRYGDILNYEINIDPGMKNVKMIKLVLQPLVENAIYHGIKNKRGRGHLWVNADYTDETKKYIRFSVKDDGAGFTSRRLAEVYQELNQGDGSPEKLTSVYGLYNVHKKLKLYYGDQNEGLVIQSEEKKGCTISFVVPCLWEEENV